MLMLITNHSDLFTVTNIHIPPATNFHVFLFELEFNGFITVSICLYIATNKSLNIPNALLFQSLQSDCSLLFLTTSCDAKTCDMRGKFTITPSPTNKEFLRCLAPEQTEPIHK